MALVYATSPRGLPQPERLFHGRYPGQTAEAIGIDFSMIVTGAEKAPTLRISRLADPGQRIGAVFFSNLNPRLCAIL
jgi:hypothetical protein